MLASVGRVFTGSTLDVCWHNGADWLHCVGRQTLWGGWCVIGPRHRFYFAGDTGYNNTLFKLIGRQYGPFDLAALPIGAYSPRCRFVF